MKTKTLILSLGLTLMIPLTVLLTPSCSTTPIQNTIKAEGVLITTVDTAMQIWKQQVIAGKATQQQIDAVHQAYDAYYTAQQAAKAAIELVLANNSTNQVDIATANAGVNNAEIQLLNLINSYLTPKNP